MQVNQSALGRSRRSCIKAAMFILSVAATPAVAAPRSLPRAGVTTTYDAAGPYAPGRTGSLRGTRDLADTPRSLRSSTLGNAEFPERDPIAQNLGGTAGGGLD